MWSQEYRKFSLLVILFLALGSANARILKRDTSSESSSDSDSGSDGSDNEMSDMFLEALHNGIQALVKIPGIGTYISSSLNQAYSDIARFEKLSNGAIGRILGGALPCTVDKKYGITCEGLSENGGMSTIVVDAINNVPNEVYPQIAKKMTILAINGLANPTFDTILGGLTQIQELSGES